MREPPVLLGDAMRKVVAETIHAAALHHCWSIHALNVRSNHVHIVISAPDQDAGYVMRILKGRSSLALSAIEPRRRMWWTRQGSKKRVYSDASLEAAVRYVANQDKSWLNDTPIHKHQRDAEAPHGNAGT